MPDLHPESPEFQAREIRKFARVLGIAAAGLALLPVLLGWLGTPEGQRYLPFHLSLDDHMVYAAWMRQAMDGQFLFDNRFTTDAQPGLTVHVYFFLLGLVAKLLGIPLTLTLARVGFTFLAVRLLGEFLVKIGLRSFTGKFALVMSCFGGGLAFLSWEMFGDALTSGPGWFSSLMHGRQPIDNWQPEAFVFPSMLTNGLFMAALCLILATLVCVLGARDSWRPVLPGALSFAVLMNIHSYDVLLMALVLAAFLACLAANRSVDAAWTARTVVIGLGAVPAALWFLYVLKVDPVFQARADTLTFTGSFRQVVVGLLPLIVLALLALFRSDLDRTRKAIGGGGLALLVGSLFVMAGGHDSGYFLSASRWAFAAVVAVGVAVAVSKKDVGWNLLWSWAMVGLVAPYFPALFQRKLSMMLVVPWAILAAIGLAGELQRLERQPRNLVAALALAAVCMTSVFWLRRDLELSRLGVSKTLMHNTYLTRDEAQIVEALNEVEGSPGVLAMPGFMNPELGNPAYLNDLAPVLSGLAGAYSYAGHWSETPDYLERRNEATRFYIADASTEDRRATLREWGIEYVVAPVPSTYAALPLVDLSGLGETVYQGQQLSLIRVR